MRQTRCHIYLLRPLVIYWLLQAASVCGEKPTEPDKSVNVSPSENLDKHDNVNKTSTIDKDRSEIPSPGTSNFRKNMDDNHISRTKSHNETMNTPFHHALHKATQEHVNNLAKLANHSRYMTTTTEQPEEKENNTVVVLKTNNNTIQHEIKKNETVPEDVKPTKAVVHATNITTAREKAGKVVNGTLVGAGVAGVVLKPHGTEGKNGNATQSSEGNTTEKCTPPAIKQFPHPLMSPNARRHGGLIIHVIVAMYMFLGLAVVCDEYFVASLDRICEELKMSPDVAGATFMAAGSSAPELATVIIGVFFAKDDIGISGVIGSAVFNIMFVISCCGLCSTAVVYLNWWPLIRDCFFYAISILVMLIVISNEEISWYESMCMILVYVVYCVVLRFNTPLEKWAQTWPVPFKKIQPNEQSGLVSYKTLEEDGKHPNYGMDWSPEKPPENPDDGMKNFGMEWSPEKNQQSFANQLSGPALNQATTDVSPNPPAPARPNQQEYYKPKEYDPANQVNPLIRPDGGLYAQVSWGIVFPIHWFCRKTMPDCRSERFRNWYPFTFFVSMMWISFYSYFMVWMITIIGYTLGIPDTVMGLTFVAAGVSVPDALSSIAVIKEGYGDMAVSNAVGSNVFDILICLGLPWFIKTAIIRPGTTVRVISKGLTYSTLSLLSTVVFLVVATHLNGWKLDRRYGIILMVWYLIFITIASMYELNFFGNMNPPECSTDW